MPTEVDAVVASDEAWERSDRTGRDGQIGSAARDETLTEESTDLLRNTLTQVETRRIIATDENVDGMSRNARSDAYEDTVSVFARSQACADEVLSSSTKVWTCQRRLPRKVNTGCRGTMVSRTA